MNGAQTHLLINHLPVLVPLIGMGMILVGLKIRSWDVRLAGAWLLVIGALCAIPVYLTGEPAEDVVKNFPGASRLLIEDHETAALYALIFLEVSGAASLVMICGAYARRSFAQSKTFWIALTLFSAFSFVAVARAAHLGGLIRHEEIRKTDRY